jgi:tight adherence protein C
MNMLFLLLPVIGGALLIIIAVGFVLTEVVRRQDMIKQRILLVQGRQAPGPVMRVNRLESSLGAIRRLGGVIIESGVLSRKATADLEQTLAAAGYRSSNAVALVVGSKLVAMTGTPLVAWLLAESLGGGGRAVQWLAVLGGASIGLMLPDLIIKRMRDRYLAQVESGLPDALDLLVICADAGLPLETALARVALEFRESDAPTANELSLTAGEMRVLPDRRQALINLGVRTGLESLIALGGTLAQTLQYGTPLTQALRVLSAEMRHTMLMRFEERAARLPILLTLPMIGFFLPCVIIVVLAPAGIRAYNMMKG